MNDTSRLTRDIQAMPENVRDALNSRKLMAAYEERPAYQRNDYLAWIEPCEAPRDAAEAPGTNAGRAYAGRCVHGDTEAIAEAKGKGFVDVLVDGVKAIEYQGKVLIR